MMAASKPTRPAPPKPSKPGQVKVVRAMYKYEAQYGDELSFDEGDLLYITDQTDKNWWKARVGNKTGIIPTNYVEDNTESIDNPLHEAAKRGNMGFLSECLQNRVSVNGLDKAGSTPLHWAAHGGHIECLRSLLAQPKCEFDVQNKLGDTPLHSAAWKGHAEAVEILLERGANTNVRNKDGKTPSELAKDSKTAALLKLYVQPIQYEEDYGAEEDSD